MKPPTTSALATLAAATVLPLATTLTAAPATAAPDRVSDHAFSGRAFGSFAKAESLAVGSAPTAPTRLGCTRRTDRARQNAVTTAGGQPGSALQVSGVRNQTASFRTRRQDGTRSVSTVAEAVLGRQDGPHLVLRQLRTTATAYAHRRTGRLGARVSARSAELVAHTGTPVDLLLNRADDGFTVLQDLIADAGGTLVVPGLGELRTGEQVTRTRRLRATARGSVLRALLYGEDGRRGGKDDVTAVLAGSRAVVHDEVRSGVFRGGSVPVQAVTAGGLLSVGRVVDLPLPCPGTRGTVRRAGASSLDLGDAGLVDVADLRGRVFGTETRRSAARAWTSSSVAAVTLGGGEVEVSGLTGRVNVRTDRKGRLAGTTFRGSRVGRLVIGGEQQPAPSPGDVIEVPGVGTLEFFVRDRRTRGASVTALRVTLLPGTPGESVVDLGQARAFIDRD